MKPQPPSRESIDPSTRIQTGEPFRRRVFALLAPLAVVVAAFALSSCAGYTSPGGQLQTSSGVLSPSATTLSFGSISVGSNATQSLSLTNTGTAAVNIASATISGAGYTVVGGNPASSLPIGQSTTVQIQFAPQAAGAASASLVVSSDASNSPLTISLTGTGTQTGMTISPSSLSFGNVTVGQTSSQTVTLTNTGNVNLVVSAATVSGTGFGITGLALPATITTGQNVSFSAQFTPTVTGAANGSINFTDNASGSQQSLTLVGTGVAAGATLTASPGSVNFGNTVVGSSANQTITLSNTGTASITVTQVTASGTGFSVTGITTPVTLSGGQTTNFTAVFSPTATGVDSGSISIVSSGSNPTVALTGTGTQGALSANPASIAFGSLLDGSSGSVPVTLTNTGTASVTISAASASGTGFTISGLTVPVTINAGQNTSVTAKFSPTNPGAVTGNISITSNAPGSPLLIALSGTGTASQPQLTISPASVAFGNVNVGGTSPQTVTLTNTGNAALTISAASASGSGFSMSGLAVPATINAGANTTFTTQFAPTASGSATGSISITSNAPGSPASIALSGTGIQPQISASPSTVAFGNVTTGTSNSQTITVTNNGTATLTISAAGATGAGISISGLTLPTSILAGKNSSFNIVFSPAAAGLVNGTVSLTNNASGSPLSIPVSGTGVAATLLLGANPASLAFGNVSTGSNKSLNVTLTNNGNSNVTISGVTPTGTGLTTSGVASGLTLTPNQTATLTVTFTPTTNGSFPGSVSVASNATNSPAVVSLTASSYVVALSWTPSSSTDVVSYNVYRGTVPGTYTILNTSPVTTTQFTDTSVSDNVTYYYVVTAVDSNGVQSSDSNQATAPIPVT